MKKIEINHSAMRLVLKVTKALSDTQRVRILMLLRGGELCVCQIVEVIGLAPSTISKHLSILSAADLVEMRKDGRWAYYRLPETANHPALTWLNTALSRDAIVRQDAKKLKAVASCTPRAISLRQRNKRHAE
jgi:ArsR family transcriptional regulator, arsenate/arsenite/antimonite-responsive transcriptional repressor